MKKKLILSIIVLLVVAGGILYYLLEVKEYDTADENVDKIIATEYEISLPAQNPQIDNEAENSNEQATNKETNLESSHTIDEENEVVNSQNQEEQTNPIQSNSTQTNTTSNGTQTKNQDKKTAQTDTQKEDTNPATSITSKYEASFREIETQAIQKIDSLISIGIEEYKTKKSNDEDVSYFYFYSKYSRAGNVLEAKTDEAFQTVYKALTNELVANGLDKSYAKPYLDQYNSSKESRRDALLSKAMAHLK
ncbi:hypothetical protein DZB84_21405 [Bacillus sp. HNG]|uniref:hypothetical protein n=1 Tax=Bacillus sp. HNG TaxID=2293325 RepID=UPI000E2EAC9B|nr:hypothetical protein [Bacillus sp. HNG]RFB11068.1 hypothetical protein DZB84_21405 [Bacillus sp. HNG]